MNTLRHDETKVYSRIIGPGVLLLTSFLLGACGGDAPVKAEEDKTPYTEKVEPSRWKITDVDYPGRTTYHAEGNNNDVYFVEFRDANGIKLWCVEIIPIEDSAEAKLDCNWDLYNQSVAAASQTTDTVHP